MYGPLPIEWVSKYVWALSVVDASAASLAPFCCATVLSTTPVDLYAIKYGIAGFGCFVTILTVYWPTAVTLAKLFVTNAGAELTFLTRSRLKTTSFAVSGWPLLNWTPFLSTNVQTLPALFDLYDCASHGTGWLRLTESLPLTLRALKLVNVS